MKLEHLVIITNSGYPDSKQEYIGSIFVFVMVQELRKYIKHITVIAPRPYVPSFFAKSKRLQKKGLFLEDYKEENVSVYYPRYIRYRKKYPFTLMTGVVDRVLKRYSIIPDLVHAHFLIPSGPIGESVSKKYGVPLVITGHGQEVYKLPFVYKRYRDLASRALLWAKKITTVSRKNKEKMCELLPQADKKINIIYNGFDERVFHIRDQDTARKRLQIAEQGMICLQVGRLDKNKNQEGTIDAFASVLQQQSIPEDLCLYIVGDDVDGGRYRKTLEKKIKNLGLDNRIFLQPQVDHETLSWYYAAANILLVPSFEEGNPTVLFEGMACGLPVVGSAIGGIEEMITNTRLGILFDPKQIDSYVAALSTAVHTTYNREYIASYIQPYTTQNIAKQFLALYEALL